MVDIAQAPLNGTVGINKAVAGVGADALAGAVTTVVVTLLGTTDPAMHGAIHTIVSCVLVGLAVWLTPHRFGA